jgi:hypothetical protein
MRSDLFALSLGAVGLQNCHPGREAVSDVMHHDGRLVVAPSQHQHSAAGGDCQGQPPPDMAPAETVNVAAIPVQAPHDPLCAPFYCPFVA